MEFFGIRGFGHKPERSVRTVAAEKVVSELGTMPDVQEAIAAFTELQGNIISNGRAFNDANLLAERRLTVVKALKKQGIALEVVPGKYDSATDESIETLVQKYNEYLATLEQKDT